MKIKLLGQDAEFIEEAHQQVEVARGIFVASIHQYGACPSVYSHDWLLEARTLGQRARYGEGRAKSLEEAAKAVNDLAMKLSQEMFNLAQPWVLGFPPPQGLG